MDNPSAVEWEKCHSVFTNINSFCHFETGNVFYRGWNKGLEKLCNTEKQMVVHCISKWEDVSIIIRYTKSNPI